ncbi:MAG: flagellar hook-length control protein FliK [Parasporobacterium sp.]|nr:flagellar hook-length control protein FliK [Parasporobacterium sp.]
MEISNSNLNNLINSLNGNAAANEAGAVSSAPQGSGLVGGIPVGSYLSGQISDLIGNNVTLTLSDGSTLGARLSSDMALNIGDSLILQVKENADNKMVLKTVSSYNSANNLISNALKSANLPETTKNIAVINELIKNGQPLNKQTIQSVLYGTQLDPNADLSDVIDLVKHGMEMTKENLTQYANYKELNYNMANEMKNFATNVENSLSNINPQNFEAAKTIVSEALNILSTNYEEMPGVNGENTAAEANVSQNPEAAKAANPALQTNSEEMTAGTQTNSQNVSTEQAVLQGDISKSIAFSNEGSANADNFVKLLNESFPGKDTSKIQNMIKDGASFSDVLKELSSLIKDSDASAINLLKSKDFSALLKDAAASRWTLDPAKFNTNEAGKSEYIKEMYSKIVHDADKLNQLFENNALTKGLADSMASIKSNAEFANNLNNIMSYVQIPIKFDDNNSHGDLYVYNNKKQKYVPGDLITAHLFLELENLGATDVHIKMQGKSTSTNFVLEDDLSMQIVEEHMPELLKRLEAKGYSCSYKVETLEEAKVSSPDLPIGSNPLGEILPNDSSVVTVKRYNFDVRA